MKVLTFLIVISLVTRPGSGRAGGSLELEAGWLRAGRVDVRIPGDSGTRFSLTDELSADETVYSRLRASWRSAPRHVWQLAWVPLEVTATGNLERDTQYVDTLFPAGAPVRGTYRFNNYRLSYRYRVWQSGRFAADAGGTLFVRNAKVTLRSGDLEDSKSDLGLVPLLSFGLEWDLLPDLSLVLDGDALAAPQGRALDVLMALRYAWSDRLRLGAGYRVLEGGADNDEVYTFALFHHLAFQGTWHF